MKGSQIFKVLALVAIATVAACLKHNDAAIARTVVHLLAGDCAEVAHIHKGAAPVVIERFCNGVENATEYQVDMVKADAGSD